MNSVLNRVDLRTLLESSSEVFLPLAFLNLTGRAPDFIGVLHYARRLKQGFSRVLIVAELASSKEGQSHVAFNSSPELDLVVRGYRRVRNWPLGRVRWALLPKVVANLPDERAFDWELWADNYVADQLDRKARQAATQLSSETRDATETRAAGQPSAFTAEKYPLLIDQFQLQLNRIADALQTHGVNIPASLPLSNGFQVTDSVQISWQARQHYKLLIQELLP